MQRALLRRPRYDLIAPDEVACVSLAEARAKFPFQVIAKRAEPAAIIIATNLPFSAPNPLGSISHEFRALHSPACNPALLCRVGFPSPVRR
ncbi:MAG: ATP-binding protein [Terriglobales bacterium]